MESKDWGDVAIDDVAEVELEILNTAEPEVFSAYEHALEVGSHGLVFSDAID